MLYFSEKRTCMLVTFLNYNEQLILHLHTSMIKREKILYTFIAQTECPLEILALKIFAQKETSKTIE